MYYKLKEICPNIPIHASNLYDTSKEEMTNKKKMINPKNQYQTSLLQNLLYKNVIHKETKIYHFDC